MSCETCLAKLDDYIDAGLQPPQARLIEEHLLACESCRAEAASLRELLAEVAELPLSLPLAQDSWNDVLARIESPASETIGWRAGWGIAAAAVLCFLLVTAGLSRQGPPTAPRSAASTSLAPVASTVSQRALAENEFKKAKLELMIQLEQRRSELSPETMDIVETNLAVIEESLQRIRTALEQDPANAELERLLIATYHTEIQLLRQVTRL